MLVMKWKWNKVHFEAIAPWANAHCELKVKQHSVWSYRSLSYCSLWTESETTFSLKLSLLELLLIVNWKWNTLSLKLSIIELFIIVNWKLNNIQFEAIAPWAIAHCELKVKQHSVWSYRSLSYCSLWTESETTFSLKLSLLELLFIVNWKWNNIQFEAIAPWAIAHCELKVKQHSVWSYRSLSYCSLWTESETTFSLKLSLLELLLIVNWKWNNIQFEAIAPWAIVHCELKVKQHSVWSYRSLSYCSLSTESETTFSLKLLLLELLLIVNWKWNNIRCEAIAPCAIAHCELKVKQHSVWSYCSLSYCSLWTERETTFGLKLLLLALLLIVAELKVKQHSVWSYCSLSYCSLWTESETTFRWSYRSLSYCSLWTESETTFRLKLLLIELLLIVNWKWNNIQFEAIAPWAIAHCEPKVKQQSVWRYRSFQSYRS